MERLAVLGAGMTALAALALGAVACSGSNNGDAGDATPSDVAPAEASADVLSDGAPGDIVADGGALDAGCNGAGTPTFVAMNVITRFTNACPREAGTDGLTFTASIALTNTGAAPITNLAADHAEVTDLAGLGVVLAFPITPIHLDRLCPGASTTLAVTRAAGAPTPGNTCTALTCGAGYRVRVPLTGDSFPTGTTAASEPSVVTCTP